LQAHLSLAQENYSQSLSSRQAVSILASFSGNRCINEREKWCVKLPRDDEVIFNNQFPFVSPRQEELNKEQLACRSMTFTTRNVALINRRFSLSN